MKAKSLLAVSHLDCGRGGRDSGDVRTLLNHHGLRSDFRVELPVEDPVLHRAVVVGGVFRGRVRGQNNHSHVVVLYGDEGPAVYGVGDVNDCNVVVKVQRAAVNSVHVVAVVVRGAVVAVVVGVTSVVVGRRLEALSLCGIELEELEIITPVFHPYLGRDSLKLRVVVLEGRHLDDVCRPERHLW